MNELSLFTGAGGGLLGTHLLGWSPVGYVEWNEYCQRVIAARIADGYLPVAPIFTDVREFVQSGAAEQYRGIADVVTAGFPCQPFSLAGKQRAADDERNMWPATRDVIRIVRPPYILLENVAGLLVCGYAAVVTADLAQMGYVGRAGCVSAADLGADHVRERWWVRAHAAALRRNEGERRESGRGRQLRNRPLGRPNPWPQSIHDNEVRSRFVRVVDGVAHRVERLGAIGNGQVPAVVARAWTELAA